MHICISLFRVPNRRSLHAVAPATHSLSCSIRLSQLKHRHLTQPWRTENSKLLSKDTYDVLFHLVNGQLNWISDSIEALLGWRPEELHNKAIDQLADPSEPAAMQAVLLAATTGQQAEAEARLKHRNGHWRWTHISLAPRGDPAGAIGCIRDIHRHGKHHQRLEASYQALAESEKRYRLLAEKADDVLFQADPSGVPTWFSASLAKWTGWLPEELIGHGLGRLVHAEDQPNYRAALAALRGDGHQRVELRLRCKDGRDTWIAINLSRLQDRDGTTIDVLGGWRDIGREIQQRKLLAEGCRDKVESENLLKQVDELTAIGLCLISAEDGQIVKVNPALCRMLCRDEKTLLRSTWPELVHPEDREEDTELMERMKANHIPSSRLVRRLLKSDGESVWGDLLISCIRNDDASVRLLIAQVIEITEQRETSPQITGNQAQPSSIVNHIDAVEYRKDRTSHCLDADRGAAERTSRPAHDCLGKTDADLLAAEVVATVNTLNEEVFDEGKAIYREKKLATPSGEERANLAEKELIPCQGQDDDLNSHATDITALKQAERALRESEQHFRLLAENSSDVVLRLTEDGRIIWVSPALRTALGWEPEEWTEQFYATFLSDRGEATKYKENQERLCLGESIVAREQVLAKDGQFHWIEIHASPYRDGADEISGSVVSFRVIDEEVAAEEALRRSEERHRLLADSALDMIWTMEVDGTISYISPAVETLRGFTTEEALSQSLEQIGTPEAVELTVNYLRKTKSAITAGVKPENLQAELEYYCKDGSTTWCEVLAIPLLDEQGVFIQLLGTSRNIQERKLHELELQQAHDQEQAARLALIEANNALSVANTKLQELATTDPLTGISNRRTFEARLDAEIARSRRYGSALSVVMFDIDHFKAINDTHGHQVGDEVLVEICQRISCHLRRTDTLARWGGEEFMVLLPHCQDNEGNNLAEKLRNLIVSQPIGPVPTASASFGVTQLEEGEDRDHLLRRLDKAMYQAKALGRNQVVQARSTVNRSSH